ncbi:EH domain-containing protein 3 isoform X1 [Homalodisca vitripennis]|uniref:EH domain-containing protein 3 isoform X1 n=1 Tax=Homalodisca vitripennis TaxID=197043 RepID=UPI001EECA0C0|nr:EH domain-containing protein 3 isoform X1 [Homalodisca vitripennis]
MFSWLNKDDKNRPELFDNVVEGLKKIYRTKLLPLEEAYQFHDFHSPKLEDPDFDAKPMILLVGQYSTGKTTFIKYLLERDFPGIRIGPEPTTDRFIAVMHDEKEGVIPGNALVVDPKKQFKPLAKFGNAFLNRFQCSLVNSPVLKGISIVDTPGILSGEKQRVDRGYDFTGVLEWFAERVDRIILLFDAHKLDISDEFRRSIEALRGHDDKIRIVLNKADMVDHQQLMRVYGALMWSLGKVLQTPEVARVYIGSFWDQPLRYDVNRRLFEDEEQDLFKDMQSLPRNAALRKLNDLIKRARLAKVHAYIISSLRKEMPSMFGKDGKKKDLIKNLGAIYEQIQREHQISPGDFPELKRMQEGLQHQDFTKFQLIKPRLLEVVDKMLAEDIARLMAQIPHEETNAVAEPLIKGSTSKWYIMEEDGRTEERDPFYRFNKCLKRKFECNSSEMSVCIKKAKFQSCGGDDVSDDVRQFMTDVAVRMSNLSNDSKCYAKMNIERMLLEAEAYDRSLRPSAPPWPLDLSQLPPDPPPTPQTDSQSICSDTTVSTVPVDEIYHTPRTRNMSSETSTEMENNIYPTTPLVCKLS